MLPRYIIQGLALVMAIAGAGLAQVSPGDMNDDGVVNGKDIVLFVEKLLGA